MEPEKKILLVTNKNIVYMNYNYLKYLSKYFSTNRNTNKLICLPK